MNQLIYNSQEASQLLGISKSTLLRLTQEQRIKKICISKRRVGWSHAELLRFIADNQAA